MLLNDGVDPITNTTVIPQSAFKMATNVQSIVDGSAKYPEFSFSGYGMGWERFSYQGHEVYTFYDALISPELILCYHVDHHT